VTPHLISKITDSEGKVLQKLHYPKAGLDAPRVIDSRNAFLMTSMMHDVISRGTATRARVLGRQDLAGKTGTTNNLVDAWFAGYSPKQVAVSWIGYDQPRSLGKDETGGKAALPMWIHYMATALKGVPDEPYTIPDGVMTVKIDALTGTLAEEDEEGIYEYFYHENPPPVMQRDLPPMEDPSDSAFPNSMTNNPLQPQPPDLQAPPPTPAPQNHNEPNDADVVTRALNPSGF
jgi:penicillin-binding protein 1A